MSKIWFFFGAFLGIICTILIVCMISHSAEWTVKGITDTIINTLAAIGTVGAVLFSLHQVQKKPTFTIESCHISAYHDIGSKNVWPALSVAIRNNSNHELFISGISGIYYNYNGKKSSIPLVLKIGEIKIPPANISNLKLDFAYPIITSSSASNISVGYQVYSNAYEVAKIINDSILKNHPNENELNRRILSEMKIGVNSNLENISRKLTRSEINSLISFISNNLKQ